MSDVDAIVDAYGAAWLEADETERRRLLQFAWSEDGVYQDPTADISGREALIWHIGAFHQRLPGSTIAFTSGVAHHLGKIHFLWKMIGPDGQVTLEGCDFAELDPDGRICRIAGFFGAPPAIKSADV
jgi:SnoaL-like protein